MLAGVAYFDVRDARSDEYVRFTWPDFHRYIPEYQDIQLALLHLPLLYTRGGLHHLPPRWIRVRLEAGDMISLPKGIYHRFTLDDTNYVKAMRLFVGHPVWYV